MRQMMLFSFLVISIIYLSCNSIVQKKFEFFYYPAKNVYYDVTNSRYLYSLNGGKTWDTLYAKLIPEPSILGVRQTIYSDAPDAWKSNAQHIQQYSGHVIDLEKTDTGFSRQDLAAERKIKKPKPAALATTEKKPEKKPGFFKRLFGKKN